MTTHSYTEDQLVEQPASGLFSALGWQTVSAMDELFGPDGTLGHETKGEVVPTSFTPAEFQEKMKSYTESLDSLFAESKTLETEIKKRIAGLRYENGARG